MSIVSLDSRCAQSQKTIHKGTSESLDKLGAPQSKLTMLGLVIAYSPNYVNIALRWAGVNLGLQGPPSVLIWNWVAVALLLAFIARVEKRGFESISLTKPHWKDVLWGIAFWVISTATSIVLNIIAPPAQNKGLDTITNLPLPVLIALILTTGITEEILFRGYPIKRLQELTGRGWLAVLISFSIFVLPHIRFFGPEWLLYNGTGVVLLYVLYVWRRNLWPCMIMHILGNALLLVPRT